MDRPFSRVGNNSFVLEVWEASDRLSLPSSTEGSTMETRMETCAAAHLYDHTDLLIASPFRSKAKTVLVARPSHSANSDRSHYVLTATLVEPRVTPPLSLNRTKIRFVAGSNGTAPLPCTKIAKVGVSLALIVVVTLGLIAEMH
jgi:hypothetical protein